MLIIINDERAIRITLGIQRGNWSFEEKKYLKCKLLGSSFYLKFGMFND